MRELKLIVKRKVFDDIVRGARKEEVRDIRPSSESRYIVVNENGVVECDGSGNAIPVEYDAIRFRVGYESGSSNVLVEILKSYTRYIVDENDNVVEYLYDDYMYQCQEIVYELGKIIEINR